MLDKLIDLIIQFISLFQVYTFIDQYEKGVVLRCGRYHRNVDPGLRWMLPLGFERVITTNVKTEPMVFGIQSGHTDDEYAVNIQVGIEFTVEDVRQFLIEVEGPKEILMTAGSGLVMERVQGLPWDQISNPEFSNSLKRGMNRIAKRCGCKVSDVYVLDCSSGEATKYWHEGIRINVGE